MEEHSFLAFVAAEDAQQRIKRGVCQRLISDLPLGEVLIRVHYSSLNYKDALSASGNRGVTKHYPHTPGIDAAGIVIASQDPTWQVGDEVICTGYDLGMNTAGGFGQYIRVPGDWPVRKPIGFSLFTSMQIGTAGFTAALSVHALQQNGVYPKDGPILVTGATGGVGSIALMLLHKLGYTVTALTGKLTERQFLQNLGAAAIRSREDLLMGKEKLLLPSQWAGVVDTVGGEVLATAIKESGFDAVVTTCGNVASEELPLNMYPFILRGVHLHGIYSANCPRAKRLVIWSLLADAWRLTGLDDLTKLIPLTELERAITAMLAGQSRGRTVIDLEGGV